MKWDRKTISASEVNRYTYCPYQWYFERYYGRSKLFELSKSKKVEPKLKQQKTATKNTHQTRESHFARGRAFHAQEYQNLRRQQKIAFVLTVAIIIMAAICLIAFLLL